MGHASPATYAGATSSVAAGEPSLRIALLDSWLQQLVEGSGTAAAIGGLGRALARRGHRVVRVAPTFTWPRPLLRRRLLYNVQLPALLRVLDYDIIVGFDIDGFLWSGRAGQTAYLCSIKGVLAEELQHERGLTRLLLWSMSRLERSNARRAPQVITTSAYCQQAIQQHYAVPLERIHLVPEGIDLPQWRQALARLDVPHEPLTVLCVARQYPRKRIADLLRAFVRVRARLPAARLVIIGDGPEHRWLRALVAALGLADAVQLLGGLPDDAAVKAWYKRSAIFCLPSIQEGFGIVLLEAMAGGLPIVSTTAAAIPEVVPQRQAGILVPPANPVALADALIELLEQPALRAAYGAFGQAYVQRFDWDQVAVQFLTVVRSQLHR